MAGQKRQRAGKGRYGYIAREKKRRLAIAAFMLAIPLLIFLTGLALTGTRKNLFSILAALGAIPAAKFIVDAIMILRQKSAPKEVVERTQEAAGELPRAYELVICAYEGMLPLDAVVVCGSQVAAFSTCGDREKFAFMEKHMAKILAGNGYASVNVRIFQEEKHYLERIAQLSADPEKYRENLPEKPDERYPGLSREECILRVIMAISL